jgi:nickel superoxide dismutase
MKKIAAIAVFVAMSVAFTQSVLSHCEVPCGIYDDQMRIQMIREHIATIEKAMTKIGELSKEPTVNYNQIVRWTTNKEEHAEELQHIVQQYFMTQRIKPVDAGEERLYDRYVKHVTLLHQMLVYAMKTKQTTDTGQVEILRALTDQFEKSYFESK